MFVRLFTYTPQLKKPAENLERACYIAIPTELFDSTTVVSIFLPLEHDSLSILNRSRTCPQYTREPRRLFNISPDLKWGVCVNKKAEKC